MGSWPSFPSALWIVAGIGTIAAAIGLLLGIVAEWSVITGALETGGSFDLWLVMEAVLVAGIVVLLIATTRQARRG